MQIGPGTVVAGKYQIERALARGGMGSVWIARHVQLGSTVAVKLLDAGFAAEPAHRARFEREARSSASIKSPHVVQVQDYGFEGDTPYLVMELLEGEDLAHRLRRVRRLSIPDTARLLVQVGKALRKAHEMSIVHRDLKPANLFLARVDDDEIVKILDFGIAKDGSAPIGDATRTGEVIGSPHYMSPEQVRAERDLDGRTDLWSLAVILYRALVGVLPFPGDQMGPVLARILTEPVPPPTRLAPDLPLSMDDFFLRALARDRNQRFQTVAEMVEAFQLAAGGKEALSAISMSVNTGPVPAAQVSPGLGGTAVLTSADLVSASIGGPTPAGISRSGISGAGFSGAGFSGGGFSGGGFSGGGFSGGGFSGAGISDGGLSGGGTSAITGSGILSGAGISGSGTSAITGSGISGGLAHTGVAPARSQGPLIAIAALVGLLVVGGGLTAFLVTRSSGGDPAAPGTSVSAVPSESAAAPSAILVAPAAPGPVVPGPSAAASGSATTLPSSSATAAPSSAPGATAKPQGGAWKPPPPKGKEKWF